MYNFVMKGNNLTPQEEEWKRPTLTDCQNAAFKLGLTDADAELFFDFYEGRNWLIKEGVKVHNVNYQLKNWKNRGIFDKKRTNLDDQLERLI